MIGKIRAFLSITPKALINPTTRGVATGGLMGTRDPIWNFEDQLTLFKPGGQIMPNTLLAAPRPPCYAIPS